MIDGVSIVYLFMLAMALGIFAYYFISDHIKK